VLLVMIRETRPSRAPRRCFRSVAFIFKCSVYYNKIVINNLINKRIKEHREY